MVLGHARGSIILAAALNNMIIREYAPQKSEIISVWIWGGFKRTGFVYGHEDFRVGKAT